MFTLNLNVGSYNNCSFQFRNNDIFIFNNKGPVCQVNMNLTKKLPKDCYAIKDYSENVGMTKELKRLGIIGDNPVSIGSQGFVQYEIYEINREKALTL